MGENVLGKTWYKGNKASQKWSEDEVVKIFEETYEYVRKDSKIIYVGEVDLFMLENFGVCGATRYDWIRKTHINNIRVQNLWALIQKTIENRLVKDNEQLRPAIQSMVLQNKHGYSEKQEIKHAFKKMPKIQIEDEKIDIDIG